MAGKSLLCLPLALEKINELMQSLNDYPPRMKSLDFDIDEALRSLTPK